MILPLIIRYRILLIGYICSRSLDRSYIGLAGLAVRSFPVLSADIFDTAPDMLADTTIPVPAVLRLLSCGVMAEPNRPMSTLPADP